MNAKEQIITQSIPAGFATIASSFLIQSLEHMIPWLIASFFVVFCDLVAGIRKASFLGEEIRFSKAVRRTMGKMVTYFAFVCMIVMVDIASGSQMHIDVYSCLLVCLIELCSIFSNILKTKGINFNMIEALAVVIGKIFRVEKKELKDVLTDEHNQKS